MQSHRHVRKLFYPLVIFSQMIDIWLSFLSCVLYLWITLFFQLSLLSLPSPSLFLCVCDDGDANFQVDEWFCFRTWIYLCVFLAPPSPHPHVVKRDIHLFPCCIARHLSPCCTLVYFSIMQPKAPPIAHLIIHGKGSCSRGGCCDFSKAVFHAASIIIWPWTSFIGS